MKEEEKEVTVEDSGVKNGAQVPGLGNYADGGSDEYVKNVGLGYREDDEIDFGHFEIEVSMRNTNEHLWVYSSGLEETF